ncbi:hypothetical protein [Adonisia turfae]|uniref:Uncharacterized protein n=1 Tax=Adonisia turfae CCMR0081 TaxID=2292702 RepID=A0A6M0RRI4_9CYAN|nr:hypothetical protein [Adonisia turfae]NEZ58776.1 hypothetical protein [Adonisia turfae CCMR0081]
MPIENKSTEAKQNKGFGSGTEAKQQTKATANASDMALAIQGSMGNEALALVQQVIVAQEQVEDAAANAIVHNRAQMGARILDKVCAEVVEMGATDRIQDPDQYANQVGQAFMALTEQSRWQKSDPSQLARSKNLFLSPQQMAQQALPGA